MTNDLLHLVVVAVEEATAGAQHRRLHRQLAEEGLGFPVLTLSPALQVDQHQLQGVRAGRKGGV
eukprot:632391-Pyramimonas_sp.AAC.1